MKIALIADLHGNRPATLALEQDLELQQPNAVWCLGDVVGKGPSNDFTCDWAFAHCQLLLAGNWDLGAAGNRFVADKYYWDQLGDERMARLVSLPLEHELWLSGRRIRLFHGRPVMSDLIMTQGESERIQPFFEDGQGGRYDAVIYADAHRQGLRTLSPGLFANVGSVGNALGVNCCCYAILEGEPGKTRAPFELRFRQLEYDREQAATDALEADGLRHADAYVNEIMTGKYSRHNLPPEVQSDGWSK